MKLKVFRSFAIAIIFFCICSCTSTGFHFKTKNIDIHFEKVEAWNEKSQIKGHTGDFSLRGNGKTQFYYTDDGRPCVKVMLKNGDKEKETYLLMDTGSPGIYITKRLQEELNGTKSSYRFPVQLTGPYAKELVSNGYYFDKLEAEGFCINNILMQDLDLGDGNYGSSKEEGFVTEGILGIEALMKSNVLISYSTDELCFFSDEKEFDGKTIKLKKSALKKNRVSTTFNVKNKKYDGNIDTGANAVYLNNKVLKELEKNISFIVTERYEKTDMRYCLIDNVGFLNNRFDAVPVWNENTKGQIDRNITIGNSLLKAYDIYIDWNKCEITYVYHNKYILGFNLEQCITDNEKGLFGICLDKHGNKWLVVAKYYINEKPMIEGVGVGDELLSVNGVKISNFDWESWSDLEEADFEFLHNGEIISKKLKRRHIDEFNK